MASLISVGQILDTSFEHCRKYYKELLAIVLWLLVASLPSITVKLLAPTGEGPATTPLEWVFFSIALAGTILTWLVSVWMTATLILSIGQQASGKKIDVRKVGKDGWKIFPWYLLLSFLLFLIFAAIALITAPGYILLFVSGNNTTLAALGAPLFLIGGTISIILIAKYVVELAFAPYIFLLEKQGVVESIKSSRALVRGRWWATAVRYFLPKVLYTVVLFIATLLISGAIELLVRIIADGAPAVAFLIYATSLCLKVLLPALMVPLTLATDYYLYKSLRDTR